VTKNPKLLIALAAVVAAVAAYWMLVLSPKREELTKLDAEVAAAQADLGTKQATLATYEKSKSAYRSNYATVVRLGKAVPADDDVRSLVVQLDTAADQSGVDFKSITVGGSGGGEAAATTPGQAAPPPGTVSVGAAGFSAMPFKFSFAGRFNELSSFFARLERFVTVSNDRIDVTGRLLRLESLSLKPDSEGPGVTAEIGASSYLLPPSQGATAGATAAAPATAAASPTPAAAPATTTASATTSAGASR
jgi:Tfp pilus assembly protein PilO